MIYDPKNRSATEQIAYEFWGLAESGNESEDVPALAALIAAAEERGRRAGTEEALREVESYRAVAAYGGARTLLRELVDRIRTLAPRDSGQCEASLGAALPTHDQRRCGLRAGHEGDHDTGMHAWKQAPRDSGEGG